MNLALCKIKSAMVFAAFQNVQFSLVPGVQINNNINNNNNASVFILRRLHPDDNE